MAAIPRAQRSDTLQSFGPTIIYTRVSSRKQVGKNQGGTAAEDKVSPEVQVKACLQYASDNGIRVEEKDILREVFTSEELFARPLLSKVIEGIEAGQVKLVLVYDPERLSRVSEHVSYLRVLCDKHEARIFFVARPEANNDDPLSKVMASLLATFAEMDNQRKRERVRDARRGRAQSRKIHKDGTDKYGWVRDKEQGKRIINTEPIVVDGIPIKVHGRELSEADVVRMIYSWYDKEGWSSNRIATRLNELGIPSPGIKRIFKDGRRPHWQAKRVMVILSDPEYKGEAIALKTKVVGKGKRKRQVLRDPKEQILLPDVTPAIIDAGLWERCQQRRKANTGERTRNDKNPCLLRGLVRCGFCERRMSVGGNSKSGARIRRSQYRCFANASSTLPDGPKCKGKSLVTHIADGMVWENVSTILTKPELLKAAVDKYEQGGPDPRLLDEVTLIEREIQSIDRGHDKLYRKLQREDDEHEVQLIESQLAQGKAHRKGLLEKMATLRAQYDAQETARINYLELAELCKRASRNLNKIDFHGRRRLLERLGVMVFLNGKDDIAIKMRPKTNAFVDEPISFNYCGYDPCSIEGKETYGYGSKAPLQDYRRADGFRCGPSRR